MKKQKTRTLFTYKKEHAKLDNGFDYEQNQKVKLKCVDQTLRIMCKINLLFDILKLFSKFHIVP